MLENECDIKRAAAKKKQGQNIPQTRFATFVLQSRTALTWERIAGGRRV